MFLVYNTNKVTVSPLFANDKDEPFWDSVVEISQDLQSANPDFEDGSYGTGHSGIALFFGYLAKIKNSDRLLDCASRHLDRATTFVHRPNMPLGFFAGISGVAWTFHHLPRLFGAKPDPESTELVDAALLDAVATSPWPWEFDLVFGLSGIATYALDHPRPEWAKGLLDSILERLRELAVTTDQGVCWRTPAKLMTQENMSRFPNGRCDLGLAHGTPGVIATLARVQSSEFASEDAEPLLHESIRWLLAHRRTEGGSTFGSYVEVPSSARSAWCYGDPGVATALLAASRVLKDKGLESEALAIARCDAARDAASTGIADAGLCHGASGLAHLHHRFYAATGDEFFAQSARRWLHKSLELRRREEGFIGGFGSWWPVSRTWHPALGLLNGSAGVGLAFLAALDDKEPAWDTPLVPSIPN